MQARTVRLLITPCCASFKAMAKVVISVPEVLVATVFISLPFWQELGANLCRLHQRLCCFRHARVSVRAVLVKQECIYETHHLGWPHASMPVGIPGTMRHATAQSVLRMSLMREHVNDWRYLLSPLPKFRVSYSISVLPHKRVRIQYYTSVV